MRVAIFVSIYLIVSVLLFILFLAILDSREEEKFRIMKGVVHEERY